MGFLHHVATLLVAFWGTSLLVFSDCTSVHPANIEGGSLFPTLSSIRYHQGPRCSFWFAPVYWSAMLNLPFHVPVGHLYVFFGEFRSSAHDWVLFLLLNCMSCLYILEIKPLSVTCANKYFSPSIDCIFVLFMVSCCAKACKFGKFPFVYFCFCFCCFETLVRFMSENVLPVFSEFYYVTSSGL